MKGILISLVVSQAVCEPIARARAVEEILGLPGSCPHPLVRVGGVVCVRWGGKESRKVYHQKKNRHPKYQRFSFPVLIRLFLILLLFPFFFFEIFEAISFLT